MEDLIEELIKGLIIVGGIIFGLIMIIGIVNGDMSDSSYEEALNYCEQRNSVEYCQAQLNK